MLQNLLSNALRYTDSGSILIGVRRQLHAAVVEVWDTGVGIPASELGSIFEEFHRVTAAPGLSATAETSVHTKGLGLGLSIVQRLCQLLDHPIQVRSREGTGSCFSVSIPVTQAVEAITPAVAAMNGNRTCGLVLCIDNEQQIIDGMGHLLSDWGYTVVTGNSFNRARQALDGSIPALVIIDYHLDQGVTGLDVMAAFREVWQQDVPCMVITADYTDEVKQKIDVLGYQLLRKPVKPMGLRALLNRMMS